MLNELTISQLTQTLARREASAREAMQACLDRIARVDGAIQAFVSEGRTTSGRVTFVSGTACAVGSIPVTSTSLSFST